MKLLDLLCGLIIGFTFFAFYHTFDHHLSQAFKPEPVVHTYSRPGWSVVACDDFQKDRSGCGLTKTKD